MNKGKNETYLTPVPVVNKELQFLKLTFLEIAL